MPKKSKKDIKNNIPEITNTVTSDIKVSTLNSEKETSKKNNTNKKAPKKSKTKIEEKNTKNTTSSKITQNTKAKNKLSTTSKNLKISTNKKTKKYVKTQHKNIFTSEVEYYDLPYRYNETVVKILAQTPTTLFVYWDISDDDKNAYIKKYGENFFTSTKPVLIITNKTMNYTFEVDINDFANSWYLHLNDPNCDYSIELGRRPIAYAQNIEPYIYITTSNNMEMPNNHILFDKLGKTAFFKNIQTDYIQEKEISSLAFIKNIGKYDVYKVYKELYKDSLDIDLLKEQNLKLDFSSYNSSTFK